MKTVWVFRQGVLRSIPQPLESLRILTAMHDLGNHSLDTSFGGLRPRDLGYTAEPVDILVYADVDPAVTALIDSLDGP